jgi:hypothetical protein
MPPLIWLPGFADENKGDIAMSMNAFFVQVEDVEIARFEADPDSVEALFADQTLPTAGLLNMTAAMQERLRATGPQMMAETLSRLPEPLRQQIEASLGRTTAALASGQGGDDILKLMQKQLARRTGAAGGKREVLSLDKAWHGVHYLAESGRSGWRGIGRRPRGLLGVRPGALLPRSSSARAQRRAPPPGGGSGSCRTF